MARGPPTFTQTWGCQMIAYMFNTVLYGVGLLLVMQYFHSHSQKDTTRTKATVGILFFFATVQMTFLSHQIYLDFVTWFNRPDLLDEIPFSASTMLLAIYLTAFTAQLFFCSRIWIFAKEGKKIICTAPVLLLAVLQMAFGITQTVLVVRKGRFTLLESTAKITSTQAGSAAACDVAITVMLIWLLNSSRSGIKKTDGIVDKLILYAINRGVATSLAAVMNLILFVAIPNTFIFMIFLLPSSQLYVLSVVSMLTTRSSLRERLHAGSSDHTSIPVAMQSFPGGAPPADAIHVHRAVVTWNEDSSEDYRAPRHNKEAAERKGNYFPDA